MVSGISNLYKSGLRFNRDKYAEGLNAKANLLEQKRLATKAERQHSLGKKVEAAEDKLPKTSESLSTLGAGTSYGGQ
jgi:hypothetical protein